MKLIGFQPDVPTIFTPRKYSSYSARIMSMKNSNNTIGNRTRDLPALPRMIIRYWYNDTDRKHSPPKITVTIQMWLPYYMGFQEILSYMLNPNRGGTLIVVSEEGADLLHCCSQAGQSEGSECWNLHQRRHHHHRHHCFPVSNHKNV